MDYLPVLLTISAMHWLMAMLPGPNTVVVSWVSATSSRGRGLLVAAGVAVASLLWVVLSLWGFGVFLLDMGWLYRVMRLLGAAYLVYLGVRMLWAARRIPAADRIASRPRLGGRRPFAAGFLTTLSNPKSAVFWTSAFLVAVPPHAPAWVHAGIVAIVAAQSMLWYGIVALLFSSGPVRHRYARMVRWLDLVTGTVMIGLGLRIAEEVRRELAIRAVS